MTHQIHRSANEAEEPAATSRLRVLHVGSQQIGVFEDQVMTIAEWDDPKPIPFAPDSVLGIVSLEGRMFTVLDIANALDAAPKKHRRLIAALCGEEQLAIAVDTTEGPLEFNNSEIVSAGEFSSRMIQAVVEQAGQQIRILDLGKLFSGAIHGRERRRRSP